ncbi:type II toxin-antitoxin system toxin TscT [Mammaliicoccus fleurettii]|uniref:type II toxin-antitoxin system toxin TscT n=1 Tax=Mammaliicoccus fleurettii TaxID=150056 RepID=UPI002DBAB295|nr:DUF1474 family protein [Mammaliicoccus fleurettii]MEB8067690.1 DUF1474 family protein [Mammaliicoccus fleurettii]
MTNNMWAIENIKSEIDILQHKISDLVESNFYIIEDYLEKDQLENMKEVQHFGMAYREIRIKFTQSQELLLLYKNEMAKLVAELDSEIKKLKEVE